MLSGNLEYLTSSLPHLEFNDSQEYQRSVKGLLQKYAAKDATSIMDVLNGEGSKYLSRSQYLIFREIHLDTIYQNVFKEIRIQVLSEFSAYVFDLKIKLKAYRLNKSSKNLESDKNHWLAVLSNNPLKAEKQLLEIQWKKLEALSAFHYSNFSALIVYKLKLQILEKLWSFDQELGFRNYQQVLNLE